MSLVSLADMVVLTLRRPAEAVERIRALDLPMPSRWMALVLAVSLSTLLAGVARLAFPGEPGDPISDLMSSPLTLATLQFGALVVSAIAITVIGRAFGGQGQFDDALLLLAWVELILVGMQAAQLVLMLVMPASGVLMSLIAFALSIYLIIAVTKALHGFHSTAKVALGFIGGVFLVGSLLSLIAAATGILPEVTP